MASKQRNWLGASTLTVATTFTMWWSESFGTSGTTPSTAALKFILAIYAFLALVPVYTMIVPLHTILKHILIVPWLGYVTYFGWRKSRHLYKKPQTQQLWIHLELWAIWVHLLAVARHRYEPSLHHFFTITLFDAMFPFSGVTRASCRGQMYGVLWYCGLVGTFLVHLTHLYWTLTRRIQLVPPVKKYQLLPPAPKIKKSK